MCVCVCVLCTAKTPSNGYLLTRDRNKSQVNLKS